MKYMFHITPSQNVLPILGLGLEPRLGPRAQALGETKPAIYLFTDAEALEHALLNWVPDAFPADKLALLCVRMRGLHYRIDELVPFEAVLVKPIAPMWVSLLTEDILSLTPEGLQQLVAPYC